MKKHFNHSPFVSGVTVPFNTYRFKNTYSITSKEGRVVNGVPNGGGWHLSDNTILEDIDVTHIKVLSDDEMSRHAFTGGYRIARDIDYFGKNYPVYCGEEHGFVWESDIPEDKCIIPVSFYGYRSKRDLEHRVHIFIAQGKIVDRENVKYPDLKETLLPFFNHQDFWSNPENEIMCNYEIMSSIASLIMGKIIGVTDHFRVINNSSRGPENNKVDNYNWDNVYRYISNLLESKN